MSIRFDNNAFELKITPTKRKRESAKESQHNKENNYLFHNFMEVKSIADLVKQKKSVPETAASIMSTDPNNPYELVRKPPKKKTKHSVDGSENCFVNPALNLNGPERMFNPFEVRRMPNIEQEDHCFINPGLNIRGAERDVVNPFEVVRDDMPTQPLQLNDLQGENRVFSALLFYVCNCLIPKTVLSIEIVGIENPALEVQPTLAIGVPFTPTVGCRIDFTKIPLDALTPCSMLNSKLVFSPIKKPTDTTPKRPNLSIISEEAVDISKELDCYQLELENSINEAKATKKRGKKSLLDTRRKSNFAKRLLQAVIVDVDNESSPATPQIDDAEDTTSDDDQQLDHPANDADDHSCQETNDGHGDCPKSSTPKMPSENCIAKYPLEKSISDNPDFVYEEINEMSQRIVSTSQNRQGDAGMEENDAKTIEADTSHNEQIECVTDDDAPPNPIEKDGFKNPAPFVRTYRRDMRKPLVKPATVTIAGDTKVADAAAIAGSKTKEHHEMFGSIRSSIRKSIRKLIQPGGNTKSKSSENVSATSSSTSSSTASTASSTTSNLLASIRHSMRRKQPMKQPLATSTPCESLNDISIIDDCKPRTVFRDTACAAAEKVIAMEMEDIGGGGSGLFKGRTIRSSFRKSSRHVMRSVFKKNIEDYDLEKWTKDLKERRRCSIFFLFSHQLINLINFQLRIYLLISQQQQYLFIASNHHTNIYSLRQSWHNCSIFLFYYYLWRSTSRHEEVCVPNQSNDKTLNQIQYYSNSVILFHVPIQFYYFIFHSYLFSIIHGDIENC